MERRRARPIIRAAMDEPRRQTGDAQQGDAKQGDRAFQVGLIGFYVSCTAVGIAVAVAAVAWIVFGHVAAATVVGTVASIVAVIASVLCWHFLRVARREV